MVKKTGSQIFINFNRIGVITMKICIIFFVILISSQLESIRSQSQRNGDNVFGTVDSIVHFEAIPSDPVFDLLGLTGAKIDNPGTISKFFGDILSASDVKGNLVTGIGVSITPYQIIMGSKLRLTDYIRNPGIRFLSNIQISLGTAPSLKADSSLNWGMGVRFVFFNSGDKRLDTTSLRKIINQKEHELDTSALVNAIKNETDPIKIEELIKEWEKEKAKLTEAKNDVSPLSEKSKSINSPNWNAKSLTFDIGTIYRATNSSILSSKFTTLRAWLSGGIGAGSFQILGQFGILYQLSDSASANDSLYTTSSLMLRFGTPDFRLGIGAYALKLDKGSVALAGEIRLSSIGWITFSVERNVFKHESPSWSQSIGIKTTVGTFKF